METKGDCPHSEAIQPPGEKQMKKLGVFAAAFLLFAATQAMADSTVFLNYSSASCPDLDTTLSGYWSSMLCGSHYSEWDGPAGYKCDWPDQTRVYKYTCLTGCCQYTYYTDNDARTMATGCGSFTSAQTHFGP
jgi:hypothetical protein